MSDNRILNGPIPASFLADESQRLNSLKFDGKTLVVLNQLLLPTKFEYVLVEGVLDAFDVIKTMKVRGAPLIATVGCLGLWIELQREGLSSFNIENVTKKINYLISSRPTAIDLKNALTKLFDIFNPSKEISEVFNQSCLHLLSVYEKEKEDNRRLVWNGYQELITTFPTTEKLTIMTICNTGSLATCSWGTALGVIRALHSENRLKLVYVLETRPYNQGVRLTATELLHGNVPFKLITDSMAAWAMKNKNIDAVLTGADNVALNGDTANKIGTYMLGVLCNFHNVKFYPVVPLTSINQQIDNGSEIVIEERPQKEMITINGTLIGSEETPVWNPAFDVTPASLITKIITDFGTFEPSQLKNIFK